jgi:hypothetical protein
MADQAIQAILADARRGTFGGAVSVGATFADASAEWLRYVEHDRKRRPSTIADHRGVVEHALDREFGELPLEAVTVERIDSYRAHLVKEGKLSARTINKRLVVLHGILRPGDARLRPPVESGGARRPSADPPLRRLRGARPGPDRGARPRGRE